MYPPLHQAVILPETDRIEGVSAVVHVHRPKL